MYDVLKDIICSKTHINTFYVSRHNGKNCLKIKENDLSAKCKEINLVGFENQNTTFAFELDSKQKKFKGDSKICLYFENGKGFDKGNDGIIFTEINNKSYVFICELKDGSKSYISQFKSTKCFIDYLKSILEVFYKFDTRGLIFKYIVFSKYGTVTKDTKGNYKSRNIEGFEVFNMKCCDKVEYYIKSFI